MKKSTKRAIDTTIDDYYDDIVRETTKTAINAHILGDLLAYRMLKIPIVEFRVQQEALEFGKGYRKLMREKGASIIQGKEIPWLEEHTKRTRDQVYQIIEQGIKEGKPVADIGGKRGVPGTIAHDLKQLGIREKDYEYVRIARSEVGRIQNQGSLNRFLKNNITHVAVSDGDEFDDACRAANGQIWTIEYAQAHELEHPNCLTKDTKVMGGFYGIMRSYYSGPVIDIITKLGRRLSITPNHPILTNEGFVSANSIQNGTELICYAPFIEDSSVDSNNEDEPIVIEEIFNMLSFLSVVERMPVSPKDLHGDAMCGDGYIDIIDMHRFLPYNFKPRVLEYLSNFFLESPASDEFLLSRVCSHDFGSDSVASSLSGFPCPSEHVFFALGGVPFGSPSRLSGLRAGSNVNSSVFKPSFNNTFGTTKFLSNLSESNPGQIEIDHVFNITIRKYDDYVYDLLTNTQYYNASGVFIHNCTRVFRPIVPDDWEPVGKK